MLAYDWKRVFATALISAAVGVQCGSKTAVEVPSEFTESPPAATTDTAATSVFAVLSEMKPEALFPPQELVGYTWAAFVTSMLAANPKILDVKELSTSRSLQAYISGSDTAATIQVGYLGEAPMLRLHVQGETVYLIRDTGRPEANRLAFDTLANASSGWKDVALRLGFESVSKTEMYGQVDRARYEKRCPTGYRFYNDDQCRTDNFRCDTSAYEKPLDGWPEVSVPLNALGWQTPDKWGQSTEPPPRRCDVSRDFGFGETPPTAQERTIFQSELEINVKYTPAAEGLAAYTSTIKGPSSQEGLIWVLVAKDDCITSFDILGDQPSVITTLAAHNPSPAGGAIEGWLEVADDVARERARRMGDASITRAWAKKAADGSEDFANFVAQEIQKWKKLKTKATKLPTVNSVPPGALADVGLGERIFLTAGTTARIPWTGENALYIAATAAPNTTFAYAMSFPRASNPIDEVDIALRDLADRASAWPSLAAVTLVLHDDPTVLTPSGTATQNQAVNSYMELARRFPRAKVTVLIGSGKTLWFSQDGVLGSSTKVLPNEPPLRDFKLPVPSMCPLSDAPSGEADDLLRSLSSAR